MSSLPKPNKKISSLLDFIIQNQPLMVLTGAGCSTASGIPDYRDEKGDWKYSPPIQYQDFINNPYNRKRYWARSMIGWPRIAAAGPNPCHHALVDLEKAGLINYIITQNIDGLHQRAGSRSILDLHGKLELVVCLKCHDTISRADLQDMLWENNPGFRKISSNIAPDGDAIFTGMDFSHFQVPACRGCGGILKPDVVFFGEQVPRGRILKAVAWLKQVKGLLVIGSSLMVFSGYRFCKLARQYAKPIAIVNYGRTRADSEADLKIENSCSEVLSEVSNLLLS